MVNYIIRRLLVMSLTVVAASILVFSLVRFMPGTIVDLLTSESSSPGTTSEDLRKRFGLDEPPVQQYFRWAGNVLTGDLGTSFRTGTPIREELREVIPVSIELGFLALLISVSFSIPVGTIAALKRDTLTDYAVRGFAIWALATPSFWLSILVITWPSVWWGWSPPVQYTKLFDNPIDNLAQMWLPALIVSLALSGSVMRFTRSAMLEVMSMDYVRTARAKGLSPGIITIRHMLRNSMIPVITVIGLQVPILIGGLVITETIFGVPGMGRYLLEALNNRDYQVVQAVVLMTVVTVLFVNFFVDIFYSVLDPRITYA